jgi:homoserine kinase
LIAAMQSVTIRVPATTANLGPGYDCLGVALNIANRVTVRRSSAADHPPIVKDAAELFFSKSGVAPFGFDWKIAGDVPRSRGLGSSVTVRLGILHGLNALSGAAATAATLFELCAILEGHPDNAAPAAFGGFTVARSGAETLRCDVGAELKFVLLIPDFEVSTPEARKVLPDSIPRPGAVTSVTNACRITAAFLQRRYDLLRGCFGDGLHQPFRVPLVPLLPTVIAAGERAGALGGFLSGSGSTICCVTLDDGEAVASAMLGTAPPGSHVIIATADNEGTRVIHSEDGVS